VSLARINGLNGGAIPSTAPAADGPALSTHVVQFCDDERVLTVAAAGFLAEGIAAGQAALAFTTPVRRDALSASLRQLGLDVDYLESQSRLTILDARSTLAAFMVGDMPDARKFNQTVGAVVERLRAQNEGAVIRAFGEMVNLLWMEGNTTAALLLEEMWNELAVAHPISLLCSYAGGKFLAAAGRAERDSIARLHTHVLDNGALDDGAEATGLPVYQTLARRNAILERELEERRSLEARLREALVARKVAEDELQRASIERERLLQREREARADAEAANRAKTEFLSVMSHELRTPLNAIAGHVQLIDLELHGPVTQAQRESLARIAKSQHQLLMLVNNVLNLSRIETGQIEYAEEEIELGPLVQDVADGMAPVFERTNLTSRVSLPPADVSPLIVTADGDKVRQILVNLLTNALKFTRSGGIVTISAGESPSKPGVLTVTVRDTGLGIAAVRLRHLFEPFGQEPRSTTRHLDGAGLGLAISRDLARAMGGDLLAESVPGEGSTFTLELPRVRATVAAPSPPAVVGSTGSARPPAVEPPASAAQSAASS
jgi:signal transduction histidine kinase